MLILLMFIASTACGEQINVEEENGSRINFEVFATVSSKSLDEISGIEVSEGPRFIVHNDDGGPNLWMLDENGEIASRYRIDGAKNRDWEDLTQFSHQGRSLLAIGDIGDNLGLKSSIKIYFIESPMHESPPATSAPDTQEIDSVDIRLLHKLELSYPDGARDCEAMAYDPASEQLLLLSKWDKPPRLYGVDVAAALKAPSLQLKFLGTAATFRPPTRNDMNRLGRDGALISQPTGMDINADGSMAAVITYRSLYLFARAPDESWAEAFANPPREFPGPMSRNEEAIAFGPDMKSLFISSEDQPAPIYHVELPPPSSQEQ